MNASTTGRLLVTMAILLAGCGSPSPPRPTNVVLITIDALRADFVSYSGHTHETTPNLDALAQESAVFSQALTSFPGTTPSMPSLMSGLYPNFEDVDVWNQTTHFGFNDLETPGSEDATTLTDNLRMLAEILSEHGYLTVGFNTNPHLGSANNFSQGFEEYESFWDYLTAARKHRSHPLQVAYPPAETVFDRVVDRASSLGDRPFFLFIHLMEPHSPYLPPEDFAREFDRDFSDRTDLEINDAVYHQLLKQRGKLGRAATYPSHTDLGIDQNTFREHLLGLYEGEIKYCDREIQRLVSLLREHSLMDNTLVVITADHGEEFFDHGYVMHHLHSAIAEELIRIPLIIRPPGGIRDGRRIDDLVRMVDFAPTILDYVGLADESVHMDGHSLRPLVKGGSLESSITFISSIEYGIARSERWKYRLEKTAGPDGEPVERLFDIDADPMETTDASGLHEDLLERFRKLWKEHAHKLRARASGSVGVDVPGETAQELDQATRDQLEALGYLDD